jgi:tRNA (cmo5U34)-methyltransferase
MDASVKAKSTVDEIRERFDRDVDRFSNLETGQSATIDSPLMLELVAEAAARTTPGAKSVLDIGCGAGNYTLKLLQSLPGLDCTLVDLSRPMLDRAHDRVSAATSGPVETIQGDIREIDLAAGRFDVILSAMVLHHLRTDDEWHAVFTKLFQALRPGGSLWIADHIRHEIPEIQDAMTDRWGDYLVDFQGPPYRDKVFAYVEKEDTPHTLTFQLDTLRSVGFESIDVLHKNNLFAAFGGRKARS